MTYAARVWNDNWMNFSVLRHGAFDGFLVTSKNSGTHWVKYMFAVALADTYGIERPAYFSENAVRPYIGWPKDVPVHPQLPRLAFSHTIPHRLADWGWARRLGRLPPYALCIRHPMSILASHHAKWEYDIQVDWLEYLRGDPDGKALPLRPLLAGALLEPMGRSGAALSRIHPARPVRADARRSARHAGGHRAPLGNQPDAGRARRGGGRRHQGGDG
jgi:hypothetical protein